jgi:hypothetical protein
MPPRSAPIPEAARREGRLVLATQALQNNQNLHAYRVARLYDVPRSTIQGRLSGSLPKATINARKRKLSPTEDQALVQWILDLAQRGFPPHIINVRRMADNLLAARGQTPPPQPVGKNWVSRWINTQADLIMKWDRKLHSQRALCEDPVKINA